MYRFLLCMPASTLQTMQMAGRKAGLVVVAKFIKH
jgi:hypothetical protein